MMTKPPGPAAPLELKECGCKGNCGSNRCKCKNTTYAVQILANVALNNVPIIILMNKVTLVMKIVTKT